MDPYRTTWLLSAIKALSMGRKKKHKQTQQTPKKKLHPNDGMLFFDATSNRQLICLGGKWVPYDNQTLGIVKKEEGLWSKAKRLFKQFEVTPFRKTYFQKQ